MEHKQKVTRKYATEDIGDKVGSVDCNKNKRQFVAWVTVNVEAGSKAKRNFNVFVGESGVKTVIRGRFHADSWVE